MKKKVKNNLWECNPYSAYEADNMYKIEDVVKIFRDNIRKRKDLSEEFKNKALELPVGRDYEVVYFPAHIYQTDTTKSWNTTSKSTNRERFNVDGYDVTATSTVTTTTRHTQGGYKKTSEAKFRSSCSELCVENINLEKTTQINTNISIPMYKEDLFFTDKQNKDNATAIGRKSANAKSSDTTHIKYRLHIVIIPIFRYEFELCGKKCYFEMNLHNGTFVTHYKQKGGCAFAKVMMKFAYIALGIVMTLLPLLVLFSGFNPEAGFIKKALAVVILGACAIVGLFMGVIGGFCTSSVEFEKIFYQPKYLFDVYIAPVVIFVIILVLTLIFKGVAF